MESNLVNESEILTGSGASETDNTEILTSIEDSNKFYKVYNNEQNTISNILNKYERTKVIFERYQMIANGSKPFIKNPEKYNNIYDIVLEELKQKNTIYHKKIY